MNDETQRVHAEAPLADPESVVSLRGDPPRVMRLSRKAIGIAAACGCALVGGALIYALKPEGQMDAEELYNTEGVAVADNLAGAPTDYGQVPQLGPPLPGDLGGPILEAQRRDEIASLPPVQSPPTVTQPYPGSNPSELARQRAEQERDAARGSDLFFGSGGTPRWQCQLIGPYRTSGWHSTISGSFDHARQRARTVP